MTEQTRIDQQTQELLNAGIDGELDAAGQDELDKLLAGSEEVRKLYEDLKAFTGLMDELPELEPPQFLQSSIERQVRLPVHSNQHEEKNGFFGTWLPAHWLRTGFAIAAGMVITVGVYEMGSEPMSAEDTRNLVGTVVKNQAGDQGELLDSIHIFTDTLTGRVELRAMDNLYSLNVQLSSDGPTQVVVDYAGRGLEFAGITRKQDREDAVSIVNGSINVESSGEQRYTLQLRRIEDSQGQQAPPLALEFFANNTLVYEAELGLLR